MPQHRATTSSGGRNMVGARALWCATGMTDEDFPKPVIAISNSFTQFVSGHVHLEGLDQMVAPDLLVRDGDIAQIDIPNRTIHLDVDGEQLDNRREFQNEMGCKPEMQRPRKVSAALKAHALMATSAGKGAVSGLSGLG